MKRNKFLRMPTKPISIGKKKIGALLNNMLWSGYQGRKLAEVCEVWKNMLKEKEAVIWMGLAGAMVPAGMRKLISYLIKKRFIDVLVSTGANLYHDVHEALGRVHCVGTHLVDDRELYKKSVDRIYDVFASEKEFLKTDINIENEFAPLLEENKPYSSREITYLLGKKLVEMKEMKVKDSILVSAYKSKVPIFCPAICDSMLGVSIFVGGKKKGKKMVIDGIKDIEESALITAKSKHTGVVYIGGGVPKNFIQQTAVVAGYILSRKAFSLDKPIMLDVDKSHKYAIQITTDSPQWGGLSGCTFEEAQSWGKIGKNAEKVICHCDATIALPMISHVLYENERIVKERKKPFFKFEECRLEDLRKGGELKGVEIVYR